MAITNRAWSRHRPQASSDRDTEPRLLRDAGRRIWEHLPLLLLIDVTLALAVLPALALAAAGLELLALLVAAIACGPLLAGTIATADRLNREEAVSGAAFVRLVRRHARAGVAVSLVLAVVAAALLGATRAWLATPDAWWPLALVLPACSVAIIALVCGTSVYSLATTGGLHGWRLWRASLAIGGANPLASVGSLALLALLGLVLARIAPALLPVIPAPFAVLCSGLTWSTVARHAPENREIDRDRREPSAGPRQ